MKIIIILSLVVSMVISTTGCKLQKDSGPTPKNVQIKDNNDDSKENIVEENINGYNIEEDHKNAQNIDGDINKASSLSRYLKAQILPRAGIDNSIVVIDEYTNTLPEGISNNLKYTYYDMGFNYFLITSENGSSLHEKPTQNSTAIKSLEYLDKATIFQKVKGELLQDSDIWYKVGIQNDNQLKQGYIHSSAGLHRSFRFDNMQESVKKLIQELEKGELHYISNYKNENGAPPNVGNVLVDQYGYRSFHSAPAYMEATTNSNYRYIPDGILVRILDESGDMYHVNVPTFGADYYVPKKYINRSNFLKNLNDVIVVDRTQQNQAAFEVGKNGLNLISYTFSTTGIPGADSYETTLGSYKAIQKRDKFNYLRKDSQDIAGYAPFAIRFTGGAYIHGVPVPYDVVDGKQVDPGNIEYLHTIGTFPRSSMCVRNYTSHAQFLYDWMDIENGAVIVIE